jgi:hypothetical protein
MGEAKRRGQQGRLVATGLRERVLAGDFGPTDVAQGYLFVFDKSPVGRQLLSVLRTMPQDFTGLSALLEGEALRLWEVSPLFPWAVLYRSASRAEALLASSPERLLTESLPRAATSLSSAQARWAWEAGLEGSADASVRQLLQGRAR